MGDLGFDLDLTGFTADEIAALTPEQIEPGLTDADEVPELPEQPVTVLGDVWILGQHAWQSTTADVRLHDYGMGKAADGVANDNIYKEDLDKFQMEWWATFRTFLADNASAYIWGNSPDLWRLWYHGGLGDNENLELRNQIVWDKKAIPGMKSDLLTQFPIASEHCLFFQFGNQFRGDINTEDFPADWEPVQSYLAGEATEAGITSQDVKRVCGVGMFSHWFTKSQFTLIPENDCHHVKRWQDFTGKIAAVHAETGFQIAFRGGYKWQRKKGSK
jgi:hypothetical protein